MFQWEFDFIFWNLFHTDNNIYFFGFRVNRGIENFTDIILTLFYFIFIPHKYRKVSLVMQATGVSYS